MTPGTYLRKRRMAADLTLDEVAHTLAAMPRACGFTFDARCSLLKSALIRIEGDDAILGSDHARLVEGAFPFSATIYRRLVLVSQGLAQLLPRLCEECACSTIMLRYPTMATRWSPRHSSLCLSCAQQRAPSAAHQTANAYYRAGATA